MENGKNVIYGYKAFELKEGKLTDRYGNTYEIGKEYHVEGDIKFHKNGYHFCLNPEDTLRYVDGFNTDIVVTSVLASGDTNEYEDEYNDYYEMYAAENMKVLKTYTKEELIENQLKKSHNIKRFIDGYNLSLNDLYYILDNYNGANYDLRKYLLLHIINHKLEYFSSFIDNIDITTDEISTVLKYLEFFKLDEAQMEYVKRCLCNYLKEKNETEKARVRK